MINKETHLAIGKIHSPFALLGGVKVFCYAEEHGHLKKLKDKSLLLVKNGVVSEIKVVRVEFKGDWPIFFFDSCTTPEDAKEKLKGGELYAPRHLVSPLEDDEFYLSDLIGLSILFANHKIGSIINYFDAAHTIVEVQMLDGQIKYFPFIAHYFAQPDFTAKEVTLICEDLLE